MFSEPTVTLELTPNQLGVVQHCLRAGAAQGIQGGPNVDPLAVIRLIDEINQKVEVASASLKPTNGDAEAPQPEAH